MAAYRNTCDSCGDSKVKCSGFVLGASCERCAKKGTGCHFSLKKKTGPKGKKGEAEPNQDRESSPDASSPTLPATAFTTATATNAAPSRRSHGSTKGGSNKASSNKAGRSKTGNGSNNSIHGNTNSGSGSGRTQVSSILGNTVAPPACSEIDQAAADAALGVFAAAAGSLVVGGHSGGGKLGGCQFPHRGFGGAAIGMTKTPVPLWPIMLPFDVQVESEEEGDEVEYPVRSPPSNLVRAPSGASTGTGWSFNALRSPLNFSDGEEQLPTSFLSTPDVGYGKPPEKAGPAVDGGDIRSFRALRSPLNCSNGGEELPASFPAFEQSGGGKPAEMAGPAATGGDSKSMYGLTSRYHCFGGRATSFKAFEQSGESKLAEWVGPAGISGGGDGVIGGEGGGGHEAIGGRLSGGGGGGGASSFVSLLPVFSSKGDDVRFLAEALEEVDAVLRSLFNTSNGEKRQPVSSSSIPDVGDGEVLEMAGPAADGGGGDSKSLYGLNSPYYCLGKETTSFPAFEQSGGGKPAESARPARVGRDSKNLYGLSFSYSCLGEETISFPAFKQSGGGKSAELARLARVGCDESNVYGLGSTYTCLHGQTTTFPSFEQSSGGKPAESVGPAGVGGGGGEVVGGEGGGGHEAIGGRLGGGGGSGCASSFVSLLPVFSSKGDDVRFLAEALEEADAGGLHQGQPQPQPQPQPQSRMKRKAERQPPTGSESRLTMPAVGPLKRSKIGRPLSTAARTGIAVAAALPPSALAANKKRKADLQPLIEPGTAHVRPVGGPPKRSKYVHPALATVARIDVPAASAALTPVLAAATLQPPHKQPQDVPRFPLLEPRLGDVCDTLGSLLSRSRSSITPDGGVGGGGWQGHGLLPQQAGVAAFDDINCTGIGPSNGNDTASGGSGSGDDVASGVDWLAMYAPSGVFVDSRLPTSSRG